MKTICSHAGCTKLVELPARRCEKHQAVFERMQEERKARRRQYADSRRGSASSRGYDRRWQKFRRRFLADNPACAHCGRIAEEVDHITPLVIEPDRKYDLTNLQPLCHRCHSIKTSSVDAKLIARFKLDGGIRREST